jgi:hypothetical protein
MFEKWLVRGSMLRGVVLMSKVEKSRPNITATCWSGITNNTSRLIDYNTSSTRKDTTLLLLEYYLLVQSRVVNLVKVDGRLFDIFGVLTGSTIHL